jgi:PKD repeat protein
LIGKVVVADNFGVVYNDLLTVAAPSANFTASPTNGVAPLNVAFTDTSSGSPTSWAWTFGDGGTSTAQSPNYIYTVPGTYSVTLIASNSGGSSTNTQANLITVMPAAPVALFSGSPTSGTEPLAVSFADTSTGTITNRYWDFGDTSTTNLTTNGVSHVYAAGTYNVTLIVSGPGGDGTNTQLGYITALTAFQSWQNQYFGSTTNPLAAAGADPLGKGISNTNQFLMGLNPTNPASVFRIISIATTGNDVVVTWQTSGGDASGLFGSGKTNVLEVTPGLADGSYSNNFVSADVTNVITTLGDVITNAVDVGGATNIPSRYYQIHFISP